jgi:hypothetical protein
MELLLMETLTAYLSGTSTWLYGTLELLVIFLYGAEFLHKEEVKEIIAKF